MVIEGVRYQFWFRGEPKALVSGSILGMWRVHVRDAGKNFVPISDLSLYSFIGLHRATGPISVATSAGRREREKNAVERASIAADRGEDGGTFHPGHHDNIRASSAISTAQGEVRQAAAWRRPAVPGTERRGHLPCTMEKEMF